MSTKPIPKNLEDFCSLGQRYPKTERFYRLWVKTWKKGSVGITSRAVVRDGSPIDLNEPLSNVWVMKKFHQEEFNPFQISDVYVRDSFVDLAHSIIALYGGHNASSATAEFTNPFEGFKTGQRKVVIVLGTPGNRKTVFLYFLLRCRLQAKLPTILQLDHDTFLLFSKFGVHSFEESPIRLDLADKMINIAPDLWCLVDTNNTPSPFLQRSLLSIVQALSPPCSRIDWSKKSNMNVKRLFMPPFTLKEAIIARSLQITYSTEHQLQEWFKLYVPSARLAYQYAADAESYEKVILPGLFANHPYGVDSVQALADKALSFADHELGHQVFVFIPSTDYMTFTCCVPTRHLSMKLIERCRLQTDERWKQFYCMLLLTPELAATLGYVMERLVHVLLPLGGCWPLLTLSTKNHSVNQHWAVDPSKTIKKWLTIGFFENEPSRDMIHKKLTDHCFYIPNSSNRSTFHLFYHIAGHVYMFQGTVMGAQHTVDERDLDMMQQLGVKEVTYVGVVPLGQEPKFIIKKSTAETYEGLIQARYLLQIGPDSFDDKARSQTEPVDSLSMNRVSPAASPSPPIPGPSSTTMVNATDFEINKSRKRSSDEQSINDGNSATEGMLDPPPSPKRIKTLDGSSRKEGAKKRAFAN